MVIFLAIIFFPFMAENEIYQNYVSFCNECGVLCKEDHNFQEFLQLNFENQSLRDDLPQL